MGGRPRRAARDRLLEYGGLLRRSRLGKQISQKALARRLDLSDSWLSEVEQGKMDVPLSRLLTLADELGLKVSLKAWDGLDPELAVEQALESDGELDEKDRRVLLAAYRSARGSALSWRRRVPRAGFEPTTPGSSGRVSRNGTVVLGRWYYGQGPKSDPFKN